MPMDITRPNDVAPAEGGAMLATLHAMRVAVTLTDDPARLVDLRDYASSIANALRLRGDARDRQYEAAEVKLRAERKIGRFLQTIELHAGGRPAESRNTPLPVLADFGITRMQSSRWQAEAEVPGHDLGDAEDVFEGWVRDMKRQDEDLTSAGLRRLAMSRRARPEQVRPDEAREFAAVPETSDNDCEEMVCPACRGIGRVPVPR